MFCMYTAVTALLGLIYPTIVLAAAPGCTQDRCLSKVVQAQKSGACNAFFGTTIAPQSTTTTIKTRTITSFTTDVSTTTLQTTTTSTSTLIITSIVDTSGATTTTYPPTPTLTGQQQRKLLRRSEAPAVTYSSTTVPAYASKFCTDTVAYSSACSCVGATHHRTTLPLHVQTKTVTERQTTVKAISEITKTKTSTSTDISEATTSTTTTTTVQPTCTQVTADYMGIPGNVTSSVYYAGSGYEENTNNPGNDEPQKYPPETAEFTDIGANDACAAIQACADFCAQPPAYPYSFDIHYLASSATWECVGYYDNNDDPSYFNVANPDITQAYGFYLTS